MSQLNIFSTIVLSLFVILLIDCIDSSRQLSRNDRQELAKFKLTVKLLNAVLNDNDNNPDAGTGGGQGGGGEGASNRNLPAVSSGIEADNEKGVVYSDSNRKRINKQEYLRLKQEWDRQQQQPNGGVGVNNNSGTTVPVGPPRKQWGGYSAHQNGGGVYQHIDKNGKTYSTYGIPAPPVFTYYDNNRNKVSREHWRQFNSDWPKDD
ncbi:uncharacterized protein LOC128956991 [Oppia nitens]|uniref:uncharacterized protein LOC128956991 n=1 Tax=Oppia nitens TaxID=1686743 RepID=UPI0023DC9ED6|nr:uncharacterized protein LOC128956991 [Oppia nitens]